jgi:hypothetical protein
MEVLFLNHCELAGDPKEQNTVQAL